MTSPIDPIRNAALALADRIEAGILSITELSGDDNGRGGIAAVKSSSRIWLADEKMILDALRAYAAPQPVACPDGKMLTWWELASVNSEFVASLGEYRVEFLSPRGVEWREAGMKAREPEPLHRPFEKNSEAR